MASLPGEVTTVPKDQIYFNGPFLKEQKTQVKLRNQGSTSLGWVIKSTNPQRFLIEPSCGELKPQKDVILEVKCEPFDYNRDLSDRDRVTVEWVEAPEGASHFSRNWFHNSPVIRRHVFSINYNL